MRGSVSPSVFIVLEFVFVLRQAAVENPLVKSRESEMPVEQRSKIFSR